MYIIYLYACCFRGIAQVRMRNRESGAVVERSPGEGGDRQGGKEGLGCNGMDEQRVHEGETRGEERRPTCEKRGGERDRR